MGDVKRSRRGVYYDLNLSPWEFTTPHGDIFKFRSENKLNVYTRNVPERINRLHAWIERNNLTEFIPDDLLHEMESAVYRSFYKQVER